MQTLSPTQVNLALACPEKWLARYVLKEKESESPEAARGVLAHRIVEASLDIRAEPLPEVPFEEPSEDEVLEQATLEAAGRRAVDWFERHGFQLVQAERTVTWERPLGLEDVRIVVRPDALASKATGEKICLEWKFPNTSPTMAVRQDYRFQASVGALAWRSKGLDVDSAGIVYVPCDGSPILFDEWSLESEELEVSKRLKLAISVINRKSKPPRPGAHCAWCFHRPSCSAFVRRD